MPLLHRPAAAAHRVAAVAGQRRCERERVDVAPLFRCRIVREQRQPQVGQVGRGVGEHSPARRRRVEEENAVRDVEGGALLCEGCAAALHSSLQPPRLNRRDSAALARGVVEQRSVRQGDFCVAGREQRPASGCAVAEEVAGLEARARHVTRVDRAAAVGRVAGELAAVEQDVALHRRKDRTSSARGVVEESHAAKPHVGLVADSHAAPSSERAAERKRSVDDRDVRVA
eukprot:3480127-Rhodomonas_salina.1